MSLKVFASYITTKDIKCRNKIVESNINLARKVAHKMKLVCNEPYEDLEQEGLLGLIKAVERFDPHTGNSFSSFAMPYISGKILQYLRDKGHLIRLSQSTQTLIVKGNQATAILTNKLGRKPTLAEIAESINCKPERYNQAMLAKNNARLPLYVDNENAREIESYTVSSEISDDGMTIDWSGCKRKELKSLNKRRTWEILLKHQQEKSSID